MSDKNLRLEYLDSSDLAENPANWRRHGQAQIDALKGVLEEVGWAGALLYNEQTGRLIDGHARKKIASGQKVPVLIGSWSEEQEKKILLTLDPLAAMATANTDALDALLRNVQTENQAVADMLTKLAEDNGVVNLNGTGELTDVPPAIDKAAELQQVWQTERGQLWEIPSMSVAGRCHRLLCGDSTSAADVGRVMGEGKAKLFATDPPYGVDYVAVKSGIPDSGYATLDRDYTDIEADHFKDEKLQAFLESAFRAWLPYLDHAGWYLWHAYLTQGFFAAAAAADVLIHRQIIWVKSGFNLTRSGMYHWAHEPCFFGWVRGEQPPWYGEKNQRSVWPIDRHEGKGSHPTEKPVELWKAPILNHTLEGEICAEPFAGSGSQFIAAENLGRLCYGCEIEPKYVAVTLQRLKDLGLEPQLVT